MQAALIPSLIQTRTQSADKWLYEGVAFATGVLLLACLAQLQIRLPWSPVPITGQTFGVALIALTWGSKRSFSVVAGYLALGAVGAPVFAFAQGFLTGPTIGYLIGMLMASVVVGFLADRGFAKSYWRALFAAYVGSVFVFACGLYVLSHFVPKDQLLVAGLIPFLLGDFIKNAMAAGIASGLSKFSK
jgi:biotin transport system substrate-specific component